MNDKLIKQERITNLMTRFEEQYTSYKDSDYHKKQTSRDIIDPFFTAIDVDIDHKKIHIESYRQVIHENSSKPLP